MSQSSAGAVITGIGVVGPTGIGTEAHWQAVLDGKTGIDRISRFDPTQYPVKLAGEVPGFEAQEHVPSLLIPQTDRWTHLALDAAQSALADADVDPAELPEYEMAVVTASSSGGTEFGQHEMERLYQNDPSWVGAYQSIAWFYAATTGQISIRHGMRGPSGVLVSDQAGGLDAIAHACRLIRDGSDLILSGGVDASICPWGWVSHLASGRLSTVEQPDRAYLPFDTDAAGHVVGEGGALLIIEDEQAARRRGAACVYGEISGYGSTFDPRPGSGREPTLRKAIEIALDNAGLAPQDVDVVFADGAAIPELDRIEATAITEVFGPRQVPVTAPKTMTGRLGSGAAALDVAAAFLSMRTGLIPPTANVTLAPEYDIDLVTCPRPAPMSTAVVLARGVGGFNSAVVLRSIDWNEPKGRN
jgi:act minimal PKS chain-length factor (CLF/KS beta)